ncbi:uncharacterized protein LOC111045157 isoform X1 [Nilaparvata lugens]|uniref:uncharacterized protein LOC111045157 isoform X1 n=1 Tax=Nilaparvata lugens TaxID=108931 RepID=UPI00193E924C|nr:uncharacterized protein LOC111045157 isoform X1 [Nilaparvata lugens]
MGGIDDKKKKSLMPVHPNFEFVPMHAKNSDAAKKANLTKQVMVKYSDKEAEITKPLMAKYSVNEKPQVKVQPLALKCRNAVVLQFLAKLNPEDKSQKRIPEVEPKVVPSGLKDEKQNVWPSTSGDRSCSSSGKKASTSRRIKDKPRQDMGLDAF